MAAISAYVLGSVLYLYLPMIPDMAILRDRSKGGKRLFYSILALGWRGTPRQWSSLESGIKVMAIIIIPLAVSVHTIVSWDFAMTQAPMWNSTIFGPYFVADWKLIFMEQKTEETIRIWMEPFVPLRVPLIINLRRDPYERGMKTST